MDYSIFLVVVIKPFKNVEYFNENQIVQQEEATASKQSPLSFNINTGTNKCLMIGKLDQRYLSKADDI